MLFDDIVFFLNLIGITELWLHELLSGRKGQQTVSDGSESTAYHYYMKLSFIYVLVPVLSLGNFRLHTIYIGTIAGWKLTEGYITLHSITSITFHYFPLF